MAADCCRVCCSGTEPDRFHSQCGHPISSRKVEQSRSRCQEEVREEETVKRNQSKVEPISKWHCPRQAGSFKVHWREVWSFIFLLFGVYQAKAEVQVDQAHKGIAREAYHDLQDGNPWMKKRMTIWEDWCL